DEAITRLRAAIAANPAESSLPFTLGRMQEFKGRYADALPHYRKALALNPNDIAAQGCLRALLVRLGQGDEARATWQAARAAGPSSKEDWCAYTGFCLFNGQEDESRRARRTLLAHFGASTDPLVAGRTARACLLQPASEDELRQAVALAERAAAGDRSKDSWDSAGVPFAQGLAEYRQRRLARA